MAKSKTRCIGILTSGGDCPGLNAAIRAIAKTALSHYGMKVSGIQDGSGSFLSSRSCKVARKKSRDILIRRVL